MTNGQNNLSDESEKSGLELPAVPPVIFGVPVLVGVLVHVFVWSGAIFGGIVGVVIGVVLVLVGLGMIYWSWVTMRAHGEHPEPGHPTETLVTLGPFKRTRNPIYVGFMLIGAGVAVAVNSLAMLIAVFVGVVALTVLVIRREEAYLEREFGEGYTAYRSRTRRWL
jgi:protein-S-isoprenylcysteine O-methyltransferase Ste14